MPELAGRIYVPKLYPVDADRAAIVDVLEDAVVQSGGKVLFSSFRDHRVAPVYLGAQDSNGGRYGMLVYPFTTTKRVTPGRPPDEHRAQIRLGDPTRNREESNEIGRDVAGVDVTLVLAVDPEKGFTVGLDPMIYADLPMGISVYYRDKHVELAEATGWGVWEREKSGGTRRASWAGLETLIGFRPDRFLDYVRFEAKASALGLNPGLRSRLAKSYQVPSSQTHRLENVFGLDSSAILDIIDANFRSGIAVRGGVAERHLERVLNEDQSTSTVTPLDADGQPDFRVVTAKGQSFTIECKTASGNTYANGDMKVEVQKTRDSGAGRKYTYDQFDLIAACIFSVTGVWEYRFRWTKDLVPWAEQPDRIQAIQRIDVTWAPSLSELLAQTPS